MNKVNNQIVLSNTVVCATMVETTTLNLQGSWLKDESPQYISYDGFRPTNKFTKLLFYPIIFENKFRIFLR